MICKIVSAATLSCLVFICSCASSPEVQSIGTQNVQQASKPDGIMVADRGSRKPEMKFERSPNFTQGSRTSKEIDTIVIHTTEGNYNERLSFEENQRNIYRGTIAWFLETRSKVSAHFVVSPSGEITQMVDSKDVAWHATYYNKRSIGIECAGWADRSETWTTQLLDALANLVAYLCSEYGIKAVHPSGDAVKDGGYFKEGGIVGHYQVQTEGSRAVEIDKLGMRSDPGLHFDWRRFMEKVNSIIRESGAH